ncbi:MAG: transcription elongation factor GreB [Idiomarina sp.]|nr:transcription elongation factor GreB [Idiomarina sp.]
MKTNLITAAGYTQLKQEFDHLWKTERPETTKKVAWAASLGDRSENADYKYNKQLLRQIDRRLRFLRKRLEDVQVISHSAQQNGRVFFGAWVEVESLDGDKKTLRIVGPDEIYRRNDYISIDSPMARALLKKQVDDEAMVTTPSGMKLWLINKIWYEKD